MIEKTSNHLLKAFLDIGELPILFQSESRVSKVGGHFIDSFLCVLQELALGRTIPLPFADVPKVIV